LEKDTISFGSVQCFKYLGSIANQSNTIEGEIKERITEGNKAFKKML
jgi:hypothetical protein